MEKIMKSLDMPRTAVDVNADLFSPNVPRPRDSRLAILAGSHRSLVLLLAAAAVIAIIVWIVTLHWDWVTAALAWEPVDYVILVFRALAKWLASAF
jgi:hypothetical protein